MDKTQGFRGEFRGFRPKLISIAVASCFVTGTVLANPTAPTVVSGTATFQQAGNLLKITNSPNAIINWQSFSIGANEITRFIQQSQSSAVLNRVTGSAGTINPSIILGALQSRLADGSRGGRVFLFNPSGILFGAGSQVDVGSLVATSLNISNQDFLANRLNFTDGAYAGSVINQGNIRTGQGGGVYLIGAAVTNDGIITTPKGEVVLAAGQSVELVNPATPNLRVQITAPDNQAVNLGTIVADTGRVGIYAGLINNSGTIRANSAVSEGGRILLKATQSVTLESSSILDASGVGGGTIEVLAEKYTGTVNVAGRLDASAPKGGNGGFIETSAGTVKIADGTVITTTAPKGKTGLWLIDPNDFTIAAYGGDITGAALASALGTTNVTKTSDDGAYGGPYGGSIFVNDPVSWNSGNSLKLIAREDVVVNQPITNSGTGGISLYGGWDGGSTAAPTVSTVTGDVLVNAPLSTTGNVFLIAGGQARQTGSGSVITANRLRIESGAASAEFTDATNLVNIIAGTAEEGFHFTNGKTLTVGTVSGLSGIEVTGTQADVGITVVGNSGAANLNVNSSITATASGSFGGHITLDVGGTVGGAINVNDVNIVATGGSSASSGSASSISLSAKTIDISNSTLRAVGAESTEFSGGDAMIDVTGFGPGGITITGSTLEATGAPGATAAQQGSAWISLSTGSVAGVAVGAGGPITISDSSIIADGLGAAIMLNSSGNITVSNSTIAATARTAADGAEGTVSLMAGAGTINTGSSELSALGKVGTDGAECCSGSGSGVGVSASGNITLGLATSNDTVSVVSTGGSIIDGNAGLNVSAPSAFLFGQGGVGSTGNPIETQVSTLGVMAYGGGIGINNSGGSLLLEGLSNFGSGATSVATTGTLTLGAPVSQSGDLSLLARSNLLVDQSITNTGGGAINLYAGWNGAAGAPVVVPGTGAVQLAASVTTSGDAALVAGNSINQMNSSGVITANGLRAEAGSAGVNLGGFANSVNTIAGKAVQGFHFSNNKTLTVGTVGALSGITVTGSTSGANIQVAGSSGAANLNVNNNITVTANGSYGGNIMLDVAGSYGGDINVNNAMLVATGGSSALAGGASTVSLSASTVNVSNSTLRATGAASTGAAGGDAMVGVYAGGPGGVTITGSTLEAKGATGATPGQQGNAWVNIGSGSVGSAAIGPGGPIVISDSSIFANGRAASIMVATSGGNITASNSTFAAVAKTGADGDEGFVTFNANAGAIDTGSSTLSALGKTAADGGGSGVSVFASGNITLGLVASNDIVGVHSNGGSIIDGNAGANVSALLASLFGSGGVGSAANPIETQVGSLSVAAYGGEIGVINAGNLQLGGVSNMGSGDTLVATTGTMTFSAPINVSGNLSLGANNGMQVEQGISSGGNLILDAGIGDLGINGVTVHGTNVDLRGQSVLVGYTTSTAPTVVSADNLMKVTTAINLNVQGGSASGASSQLSGMDVELKIGGVINVVTGSGDGAYAKISAGSPTTIIIDFPNRSSGGYFVNAAEGAISDGDTGFFANGQPAVLGENLLVTYGVVTTPPAEVIDNTNQIIASTNNQQNDPDKENKLDPETAGDPKATDGATDKKNLPVCK